jgi:2-(1,2-epoxy-1,2-dihydrophenyl)acetyl-CoA isomerase
MTVLELERRGPVLWAWLNRPEKRNALNRELLGRLLDLATTVGGQADTGAVVICGRGTAFSAGGDIREMDGMTEEAFDALVGTYRRLSEAFRASPTVSIAAINGHALAGGLELALMCDLRIAARTATVGLPDAALGLSPTSGMTWLLPRVVGLGRALHLALLGEVLDAEGARDLGLVNAVVDEHELERVAQSWAETIASHPAVAVRLTKLALQRGSESTFDQALELEQAAERECFQDPQTRARLRAFLQPKQ